jgi:hypothetical protein
MSLLLLLLLPPLVNLLERSVRSNTLLALRQTQPFLFRGHYQGRRIPDVT